MVFKALLNHTAEWKPQRCEATHEESKKYRLEWIYSGKLVGYTDILQE